MTRTPRSDARRAFQTILTASSLGVPVYASMPMPGPAPQRSVVIGVVSGSSRSSGIGIKTLDASHRLQVTCFYQDQQSCDLLADRVEQAVFDNLDVFRSKWGIIRIRKQVDSDVPPQPGMSEACVVQDYTFEMHRETST